MEEKCNFSSDEDSEDKTHCYKVEHNHISTNTTTSPLTCTNILADKNGSKSHSIDGDMENDDISPLGIPLEDIPLVDDSIANIDITVSGWQKVIQTEMC